MVSVYINRMKATVLLKFWFLTSIFQIKSLQVNQEKLFNLLGSFSLFPCYGVHVNSCVSLRVESLLEIKSRLGIDIYDNDFRINEILRIKRLILEIVESK